MVCLQLFIYIIVYIFVFRQHLSRFYERRKRNTTLRATFRSHVRNHLCYIRITLYTTLSQYNNHYKSKATKTFYEHASEQLVKNVQNQIPFSPSIALICALDCRGG